MHADDDDESVVVPEDVREYLRSSEPDAESVAIHKTNGHAAKPLGVIPGAQPICVPAGRTDAANAKRLAYHKGILRDIRWCDPWGKWLVWDGRRWASDAECRIEAMAKKVGENMWREVTPTTPKDRLQFVRASNSAKGIRDMIALTRSEHGIPILPAILDRDPWLLNVENGTIDLRTGQRRQHDKADWLTKLSPVAYDLSAKCPTWEAFLFRIMDGRQENIDYLQRLVGYCLTGRTTEHVLPFLYGTGSNGKSTFIGTVLALLGNDYGIKAPTELLMLKHGQSHPTERADLAGKRFVACIETEDGRRMAESLVKELTGGDKIRARRMREDFWEFEATHKIWLAANHKPVIRGTDHGMWRRVKLIPFTVTIPDDQQDKTLPDKLLAELPGILNWSLTGCLLWQQHGLGEPNDVRAATSSYREEMDVVGAFVAECCVTGSTFEAGAMELFKAYKEWCERNNENAVGQRTFGLQLTEKGIGTKRGGHGKTIRTGIGIVSNA